MLYSVTVVFWAVGLLAIIYAYQKWSSYRAFRTAVAQHGCKRPPKYPHRDPFFGTDLLRERKRLSDEGRLMRSFGPIFERLGKTYEEKYFDITIINTMEARNFQQVTALGFKDYGKANLVSSARMFGKGILTQDGAVWKHSRDLVKPTFARSEISDVEMFGFHFDRFLEGIPRDGTTVDLQPPIHKLVCSLLASRL
jgi:cytochrome P450